MKFNYILIVSYIFNTHTFCVKFINTKCFTYKINAREVVSKNVILLLL